MQFTELYEHTLYDAIKYITPEIWEKYKSSLIGKFEKYLDKLKMAGGTEEMTLSVLDGKKVVGSEYYSEFIESIKLIDNLLIINLEVNNVQCGWNGIYYLLYENDEYSLVLKDRSKEYDLILFDKKERREYNIYKEPITYR